MTELKIQIFGTQNCKEKNNARLADLYKKNMNKTNINVVLNNIDSGAAPATASDSAAAAASHITPAEVAHAAAMQILGEDEDKNDEEAEDDDDGTLDKLRAHLADKKPE